MKAWYFSNTDKTLRYEDGRKIRKGITHKVDPVGIRCCWHGLHGAEKALDALDYAPGPYIWRVDLEGAIDEGRNKIAAEIRTYLWGYDASKVLRKFACLCALDVIDFWDPPQIVIDYLNTQDMALRAEVAADAARAADTAVAYYTDAAVRAAAAAAYTDAARAAYNAADDARAAAARAACTASDADYLDFKTAQEKRLYRMLLGGRKK